LTNILNNPQLTLQPRDYTVFPYEPPANDQQVQNLSVLLRTKLFPELEQADEERIKEGTILGLPVLPPSPAPVRAVNPNLLNLPVGTPEEKKQWNAYKVQNAAQQYKFLETMKEKGFSPRLSVNINIAI
jgi:hypothetical protein